MLTMQRPRRWSPGAAARLDVDHSLADNLVACFVPFGDRFTEIGKSIADMNMGSSKTRVLEPSQWGETVGCTAASSAGPDWTVGPILTDWQTTTGSICWVGHIYGGTGGANNARLFGIQYNNVNGSPFSVLDMYRTNSTDEIGFACDPGGVLTETLVGGLGTDGPHVAVVTYDGANLVAWWDGARVVNTAVAGSLTWTITSRFAVGDPSGTNQPGLNAGMSLGMYWAGRVLNASEVCELTDDPFQMLWSAWRPLGRGLQLETLLFPLRTPSRQIRVRG